MGEDADEDLRRAPRVVRLANGLKKIPEPPTDPLALAQIIAEFTQHDPAFDTHRHNADRATLRGEAHRRLRRIKEEADALFALAHERDTIDPFNIALPDLVASHAQSRAPELAAGVYRALLTISNFPLAPDKQGSTGRTPVSEAVNQVLRAIAHYLATVECVAFTVSVEEALTEGEKSSLLFKSRAAMLSRAVLDILGVQVRDETLKTHLNKVRRQLAAKKPPPGHTP